MRPTAWAAIGCLLIAALAGCSGSSAPAATPAARIPVGSSSQSISVGGQSRTFHLYRPQNLTSPAPLVLMLHGGFGNGEQAENSYGWDAEADT